VVNDIFQVSSSHTFKHRRARAYWDAKQQENDSWKVHFHADYVPRTDWIATDMTDLVNKIKAEHDAWFAAVEKRIEERLSTTMVG